MLLSRNDFREAVFKRDKYTCIACKILPAVDAHHLIERRLWPDGGYYVDNGVSLCSDCHVQAEMTNFSVEDLRHQAGITKIVLPPHMYSDLIYDKWSNIITDTGARLKGDLFYDESVQKILKRGNKLELFTNWVKYPRTYHLPWSEGVGKDDRVIPNLDNFIEREVVVTEKADGESCSMYFDHIHARSVESSNHESRDWVKQFWSTIKHEIPEGWRICGGKHVCQTLY